MKSSIRILIILLGFGMAASVFTGCATQENRRTAGEYIDDQTINARVKTALLREEEVAGLDVSTTTFDGVVQLSGFVETEEQRQQAEEIAMGVDGVQTVINNVSVNPRGTEYGAPRDDQQEYPEADPAPEPEPEPQY